MSVVWIEDDDDDLTCKPLDTYNEIMTFLEDPPPWRSLCKDIQPHSKWKIKNQDIKLELRMDVSRVFQDGPETFCHADPDEDEVVRHEEKSLPKTLVCHDMANGYHDDCQHSIGTTVTDLCSHKSVTVVPIKSNGLQSFIDGTANYDAYTFYNWAGIDIFCYFSHHLITIPPLGWINVGHAHGVKVIGTIITEWAEGMEFWDTVLQSETEYKNFASAIVAIAKTLKFDGWLLNIENKILKPDVLLEFVRYLHTILHRELTDPVLIWYDSVTIEGHLNWQNALNHKNRAFFNVCDGFFTNYSWTELDVITSAKEAGSRKTDLFIGIDVWGRNFFGGGQFNIQQAVEVAFRHGCSLAIFAPAWTHEAIGSEKSDINMITSYDLDNYQRFMLRDRALWDSIWDYLNTKLPCTLPFKTSFCRGQGKKRRLYGEVLCPVPWYNLRHMQYQPNSSHGPHGYLLSTIERIIHASRHGILRNTKGIIKYTEALALSNADLRSVKSSEDVDGGLLPKSDSVTGLVDGATQTEEGDIDTHSQSNSKTMKKKIKSALKHIFRGKSSKENDIDDELGHEPKIVEEQMKLEPKDDEINSIESIDCKKPVAINDDREVVLLETIKEEVETKFISGEKEDVRLENDETVEDVQLKDQDVEEPEVIKSRSMVQVSINIKLNDPAKKTRYGLACVQDELQCLEVYFEDSFIGGSCLKVNPSDPVSPEHRFIRIFHCDFYCEDSLIVCVVTKSLRGYEQQFLNVKFYMKDANDDDHRVVLVGRHLAHATHPEESASCFVNLYPAEYPDPEFRDIQKYLLLNEPDFYVPAENSYNWHIRYYEIHLPGSRVTSINCDTGLEQGPILLGHLGICPRLREPKNGNASVPTTTETNVQ